jgi:DNA (cytosine-5)-methyltransferase 1
MTIKKNIKEAKNIINGDIRDIDFTKYKGKIDIVVGGIPCQSFSSAGKKEG